MARPCNILTVLKLRKLRDIPGRHNDGRGLHLFVQKSKSASWIFRYRDRVTGKLRDKGLGSFEGMTLERARAKAEACRNLLTNGTDPIADAQATLRAKRDAQAKAISFQGCFEHHFNNIKAGWRNKKHGAQWTSTITTHCKPLLDLPVQEIDTDAVVKVLLPIWLKNSETARRVRQRIEAVIDWAKANKRFVGDNPARLKGHLDKLLPQQPKNVVHREAVHYSEIAKFVAKASKMDTMASKALLLQILTASRPNEAVEAKWTEFDLKKNIWNVPAARMKAKKDHIVPLAPQLSKILAKLPKDDSGLLFPGLKGKPMTTAAILKLVKQLYPDKENITSHGFRSTFRDWAGAVSSHPSEVAEAALAHIIKNKAEAAYNRDKLIEKRTLMMNDWADYCFTVKPKPATKPTKKTADKR